MLLFTDGQRPPTLATLLAARHGASCVGQYGMVLSVVLAGCCVLLVPRTSNRHQVGKDEGRGTRRDACSTHSSGFELCRRVNSRLVQLR